MKLNDMTIADISTNAHKDADSYPADVRNIVIQAFTEGACWAFSHLLMEGCETAWCQQEVSRPSPFPEGLPIKAKI